MAVDVRTAVEIARPRAAVYAVAADPDRAPDWYRNIRSVEWVVGPPLAVGAQMAFVAQFLGRRMAYTYEVTDLQPEVQLVMRTAEGPFPMETTYTWADAPGGGTTMTLRNRGEPSGFGRLASALMVPAMRRANRRDLDDLKVLLEAG